MSGRFEIRRHSKSSRPSFPLWISIDLTRPELVCNYADGPAPNSVAASDLAFPVVRLHTVELVRELQLELKATHGLASSLGLSRW